MAALSIQVPYPVFYDRDGQPLDNGNIYIGVANLDPVTNPLQVYYDDALTITASQPLVTSGGYVYRNGTPTQLYVNATDFSITVNDSKDLFVYSFPEATGIGVGAASIEYDPPFTGAVTSGYTVADKLSQTVSVQDFGAVGDGVTNDTAAFDAAEAYLDTVNGGIMFVPPGDYRLNWVCTTDNITVQGSGGLGEFDAACLRPFSLSSPTVTIADGTNNIRYCQLINLHISGSDGTPSGVTNYANNAPSALLLSGGAVRTIISGCVFYNGKKTVSLEPSATYPVTGCRFINCIIRNDILDSNLSRAIYTVRLADPGYNTDNKFTLTKLNKPGDGYAAEVDGTIVGITFEVFQSYWDFKPSWGVLLKGSSGLVGDAWDLDPGVNGAIVIEADTDGDISRYISGLVRIGSQKFKFATYTVDIPVEANTFSYRHRINSPFIRGDVVFSDANDPYNTSVYLAHNSAGGYLQLSDANFVPRVDNAKSLGDAAKRWSNVYGYNIRAGDGTAFWTTATGSPEGVVTAPVGSIFTRLNGGAGTTLYIKESGSGNTGWVAK